MAYTDTLKKLAENLKTTYENTIFTNSGNVGDTREKEVIDYLTKVIDENGINSGQVDVIIYDNLFSTVFTDGTAKIVAPVESTYGIVSVKSKMGTKELDHAIEGINKYCSLKRPANGESVLQIMPDFGISVGKGLSVSGSILAQKNINCIFAFDTTVSTETIIKKVKDCGNIDLLVVPNKFCVIGRHREEFGLNRDDGNKLDNTAIFTENSIVLFVLFLQIYLARNRLIARNVQSLVFDVLRSSSITMPI